MKKENKNQHHFKSLSKLLIRATYVQFSTCFQYQSVNFAKNNLQFFFHIMFRLKDVQDIFGKNLQSLHSDCELSAVVCLSHNNGSI